MYSDHSPEPRLTPRVLVLEEGDLDTEKIIEMAHNEGAVTKNDGEIFWIVFSNEPRRVWDFTEKSLRRQFAKKAKPANDPFDRGLGAGTRVRKPRIHTGPWD